MSPRLETLEFPNELQKIIINKDHRLRTVLSVVAQYELVNDQAKEK